MKLLVLVGGIFGRVSGQRAQACTRRSPKRAAGLDQKGARAHGRVADFQRQHLSGFASRPDPFEGRLQRVTGRSARSVSAACNGCPSPALLRRLQKACPAAERPRLGEPRSSTIAPQRLDHGGFVARRLQALCPACRSANCPPGSFEELLPSFAFSAASAARLTKIGLLLLAGGARHAPRRAARGEAHHGLVDAADLFDIERAVGQPLADFLAREVRPSRSSARQDAQNAAVRDRQHVAVARPLPQSRPSRTERRRGRTACRRAPRPRPDWPLMDQPEQSEQRPQPPRRSSIVSG